MTKVVRKTNQAVGKATREQIMEVTLAFIQHEGLSALTIRTIAERAGVNVAAINYHFGSKEALINEVMLMLTAGLRQAFANLTESRDPPRQRLHRFLDELSLALLQHSDIYRQAIGAGFMAGEAKQQYFGFVRSEGIQVLRNTVREASGEPIDEPQLTLRVIQAMGGLAYPLLVASFLEDVAAVRFSDDAVRREHVRVCLDTLVGPEQRIASAEHV